MLIFGVCFILYSDKLHNHADNDQNMIKHRPSKCVCEKCVQTVQRKIDKKYNGN